MVERVDSVAATHSPFAESPLHQDKLHLSWRGKSTARASPKRRARSLPLAPSAWKSQRAEKRYRILRANALRAPMDWGSGSGFPRIALLFRSGCDRMEPTPLGSGLAVRSGRGRPPSDHP